MELFDNRYELLELIGRGGFSEVWKTRDTLTDLTLALKLYCPTTGVGADGIEMLTHEFSLVFNTNHPNLLRPNSFAICNGKVPYLTMPFCERGNVYKLAGRMSEQQAWHLIRDIAGALDYLHTRVPPIIHLDIKPANILLGDDGNYLLTDFGISSEVRVNLSSTTNGSETSNSSGTMAYMGPEKFSRNNQPVLANDIYALGVTVFELLAGYLPFGPDGGLLQKNGAEIPELPGNFSPSLKTIIDSCLQAEPWRRPLAIRLQREATSHIKENATVKLSPIYEPQDTEMQTGQVAPSQTEPEIAVGQEPSPKATLSDESKPPVKKKKQWPKLILAAVIALLAVIIGLFLIFRQAPKEAAPVEVSPVPPVETTIPTDTQAVADPPAEETVVVEEAPVKHSSQTLDLGYATWKGKSKKGKPHGYGTMTYTSSHRIDSRDPAGNIAGSGDQVEGNFIDGHLEYGTWMKANGEKIQIYIGQ